VGLTKIRLLPLNLTVLVLAEVPEVMNVPQIMLD